MMKMFASLRLALLLLAVAGGSGVHAFTSSPLPSKSATLKRPLPPTGHRSQVLLTRPSTSVTLFPSAVVNVATRSKPVVILAAAVLLIVNLQRFLWPGFSTRDPALAEPLPPGRPGCPLLGNQILFGDRASGSGAFWNRAAKRLGNARIFRFFFMGRRGISISGGDRIKKIMNTEFEEDGVYIPIRGGGPQNANMMGPSLLGEKDGEKHAYLRKLVGQALTPTAVKRAIPNLVEASRKHVHRMIAASNNDVAIAERICTDMTLEIAWKQILGLKLTTQEEELEFNGKVNDWIMGVIDPRVSLRLGMEKTRGYKAKLWLEKKIEDRMDYLIANGPDETTLSGMVFAKDEEDESQKLTLDEIIGNSLLLILAGSETSASTLTNAFLCLGKNPEAWKKLQAEQQDVIAKYGEEESMDKVVLEKECPYLDAVVKECLRIKPIASGAPRVPKASFALDGYQIPKDTLINWNIKLTHYLDPTTYEPDGSHMDVTKGFKPERWLSDATKPTTEFMPMGAGPHYCLGAYLAYAEMKIFLAVAARSIDFDLTGSAAKDKVEWKRISIIPKERNGVPLIARPKEEAVVVATA